MKILIVSNMYPSKNSPYFGIFVKKCFEQLSSNNEFDVEKSILLPNKHKLIAYIKFYLSFFIYMIKFNPDIVYCHFISHTGVLGLAAKYVFRKKFIINCHGTDIVTPLEKKSIVHKLNVVALTKTDLIIVPSQYFKKLICKIMGDSISGKVFISPSAGVSIPSFHYPYQNDIINKSQVMQIGFVGSIIHQKGINILISALELIQFPILLHVAGKGDTSVFEKIKNNNISIKIYGELPQSKLKVIYSKIDILLFPTLLKESLGLVPIEAMSYYVPVIGSDIGAVPEYVVQNMTGYLVKSGNIEELKQAINNFYYLSPENLHHLKVEARKMAEKYNELQVSNALINAIESIKVESSIFNGDNNSRGK